tara:strand:- start:4800 stop:5714 length:915 start_codon:yes stop_codon:yes gene_type:complete
MAGKLMRYPTDMIDSSMDYFKIEILKNIKAGGGISGLAGDGGSLSQLSGDTGSKRAAQISDQYTDKPAEKTIILPIPQNIQDNNGAQWGENKLNDFSAAALGIVGGAINADSIEEVGTSVTDNFKKLKEGGGGSDVANYAKMVAATTAVNALGANVTIGGLLSRASGQVINQNLEMVFSGVTIRSFNFGWDLVPRSREEAYVVKSIIKSLKIHTAAKLDNEGMGFLNAPDIFRIGYFKGGTQHPFLNRFKTCALTNMSVNYTGSGTYATYDDGTPVHMKLDLSFKELNPIYREDHESVNDAVGY